jgi:hypothetical protein
MIPVTGNGLLTLIRDFQGRSRSDTVLAADYVRDNGKPAFTAFYEAELSYRITETISNDNASYQGAQAMEKLVQRVGERLDERRIRVLIRQELESVVNDRFAELRRDVKRQIETELNEERRAVERQNYELQNALKTVFGAVLLDPLRAEVRHQMDAISAARAKAEQG